MDEKKLERDSKALSETAKIINMKVKEQNIALDVISGTNFNNRMQVALQSDKIFKAMKDLKNDSRNYVLLLLFILILFMLYILI